MRKYAYISIPALIMMIAGCSRIGADDFRSVIMMSANVVEHAVVTKAAYTGTVPSSDTPLAADLWFSMASGQYETEDATNQETYIPCHTKVTFVTGDPVAVLYEGEQDKALGGEASRKIAAAVDGAALKMYPQWGHALYEEEKTFNRTVGSFLRNGQDK